VLVRGALSTSPIVNLIGRKRREPELDPQVRAVLELRRMMKIPLLESLSPPQARKLAAEGFSPLDADPIAMAQVVDISVGSIPVRLFVPENASPGWIVYFHGGGGVIGSVAASEPATRLIAARSRCTVASVDYRLGPEDRHPAAVDDAIAAFTGLAPRAPGKIAVAGDSFGGFLAAHVDHACRARGVRAPDVQLLIYPLTDWTLTSPSIARYADGYLLTRPLLEWFRDNYLGPLADRRAASPTFWTDLRGGASAIVVTAGHDPLVDEGDGHAARLAAAGVPVRHRRYPSLVHGFLSLAGGVRAAAAAVDELSRDAAEMLA
jgi:acetyl esterase